MSLDIAAEGVPSRSVSVTFKQSLAHYARAVVALQRASLGSRVFGLIFVLVTLSGVLLSPPIQDIGSFATQIAIPGSVALGFITGYFALPFCWLMLRRRRDLVESPITFTADEVGLGYKTALYDSRVTWQYIKRVRDVGAYLFFDSGAGASLFVPKGAFEPQEFAVLKELLTERLPTSGPKVGSPPTFRARYGAWILAGASILLVGVIAFLQFGTENPGILRVGDCFDRPAFGTIDSIVRRSCDEPHDGEVIGSLTYPAAPGASYPNQDGFNQFNDAISADQISSFIRSGTDALLVATSVQFPSQASWAIGDRAVLLMATTASSGKLLSPVGRPAP
jgi:hypothetical protein